MRHSEMRHCHPSTWLRMSGFRRSRPCNSRIGMQTTGLSLTLYYERHLQSGHKNGVFRIYLSRSSSSYLRDFSIPNGIKFSTDPKDVLKLWERNARRRNRTADTRIFSPLLYRLSYPGKQIIRIFDY